MIGLALTPEQFQTLLRMVYIANTIANGHRDTDFLGDYDDLEQLVFSRAKDAGFPAAVQRHKAEGEEHHHPSQLFENDVELNKILDAYDEQVMIKLLAEKLAERDIEDQFGVTAKESMPLPDYDELLEEYTLRYENEFLVNGVLNLTVRSDTPKA